MRLDTGTYSVREQAHGIRSPPLARVGKYELVRKIATGGMAEVYLARFEWALGLEKTVVV